MYYNVHLVSLILAPYCTLPCMAQWLEPRARQLPHIAYIAIAHKDQMIMITVITVDQMIRKCAND